MDTSKSGKPSKANITGGAKIVKSDSSITAGNITIDLNTNDVTASGSVKSITTLESTGKVTMSSDSQEFSKSKNLINVIGHVRVVYQDYAATGPKAIIYTKPDGNIDKMIFTGRAQITDSMRKVAADTITINFNPKSFNAEGNVKSQFVNKNASPVSITKPTDTKKTKTTKKNNKKGPKQEVNTDENPYSLEEDPHKEKAPEPKQETKTETNKTNTGQ
jgi:lipopolysaccharide export system protein LptA